MRKTVSYFLLICTAFLIFSCNQHKSPNNTPEQSVVVAYVTAWSDIMPDPAYITHINYAFGHVDSTFDRINISNEQRLQQISALKENHPKLKILLSVGGWQSGNFSEMAADSIYRVSFSNDCKRIIDKYKLDGIDIDWEYPTSNQAGISATPQDKDNYTLLMRDIRKAIGSNKLLTLAGSCKPIYIDFKAIDKYIDFVNIMAYDMGTPPCHNASLYRSEYTDEVSVDESVNAHIDAGVPLNKLVLGMPFYGRAIDEIEEVNYNNKQILSAYTEQWDSIAKVPYFTDESGQYISSFDNEESIKLKCQYLLDKGMLGAMYWEYSADDSNGTLRKTVYNTVMNK